MRKWVKRMAARLPYAAQQSLKRAQCAWQIRNGTFTADEPEFAHLNLWVQSGDWVIDVGANIGQYTMKLSNLVGEAGRVIAFEPVPDTFALLSANAARFPMRNVTLINAAASDRVTTVGMAIPAFETGLRNYYMASVRDGEGPVELNVLALPIDSLGLGHRVSLVKIDAEGHELFVLRGMRLMLERDRPMLLVEGESEDVSELLKGLGYDAKRMAGSPNRIWSPVVPR